MSKEPSRDKANKKFDLKPIELQMINALQQVLQDQYYAALSNFLSYIAIERLAYKVTPNTKYDLKEGSLTITEAEPEPEQPKEEVAVS